MPRTVVVVGPQDQGRRMSLDDFACEITPHSVSNFFFTSNSSSPIVFIGNTR